MQIRKRKIRKKTSEPLFISTAQTSKKNTIIRYQIKVKDAIENYEKYLARLSLAKQGIKMEENSPITGKMLGSYRPCISMLRTWMLPELGQTWLYDVNDGDLQLVLDSAAAAGRSKKTVQDIRSAMQVLIKHYRRKGATKYRPEELEIPSYTRTKRKSILQPEHIVTLFSIDTTILYNHLEIDRYIHAYRFQVLTGLRPGELVGLRWSDVDFRHNMIHINRSINVDGIETVGKNENALRTIALNQLARKELIAQRILSGRSGSGDAVFPISTEANYRNRFQRYCEANELPRITAYELRHTFVSIAAALPEGELKAIVGHSKSMDTFGVYGHPVAGASEKTAVKLEHIFLEVLQSEAGTNGPSFRFQERNG